MLKLFYAPNACSLAPHIALNEAGADYEAVKVDTADGEQRSAAYLAINPKARVPSLATDRGILTEVPVLLGFIARNFPKAELAPSDSFDSSRCSPSTPIWPRPSTSPSPTSSGPSAMPTATRPRPTCAPRRQRA